MCARQVQNWEEIGRGIIILGDRCHDRKAWKWESIFNRYVVPVGTSGIKKPE